MNELAPYARHVAFAVRAFDAVTGTTIGSSVKFSATDFEGRPIMGRSVKNLRGYWVWTEGRETALWPTRVDAVPGRKLPYQPAHVLPGALPADARERLIEVALPPAAHYAFGGGVTSLMARLLDGGTPVADAFVTLEVYPSQPATLPRPAADVSPGSATTNANGDVAAFARADGRQIGQLPPDTAPAQLVVRRTINGLPRLRVTPPDFPFLTPPDPVTDGRLPLGRPLGRRVILNWNEMSSP